MPRRVPVRESLYWNTCNCILVLCEQWQKGAEGYKGDLLVIRVTGVSRSLTGKEDFLNLSVFKFRDGFHVPQVLRLYLMKNSRSWSYQ